MAVRVLPEARDDLREAVRYYRKIKPPSVGRHLAERVLGAFKAAVESIASMPRSRPVHPDLPNVRYVALRGFPYLAFYTVKGRHIVVVSVKYATRDYVDRVGKRGDGAK